MYCENCNKEHDGSYGSGRFCSVRCARAFSTKNKRLEINKKVSNRFLEKRKTNANYCSICNKTLRKYNSTGYCINCINNSEELLEFRRHRAKNASSYVTTRVSWMSRNQTSYAEKFFMTVLDNNHISYIHEYTVNVNSTKKYFLDFYIVKNGYKIDLEIDGKQHEYEDRIEHDKIRDNFLKTNGFLVYRIKWNNINKPEGKAIMKSKIDSFLDFYNSI